jgi:lipopolysaccharide export system protein LptA
MKNKLVIFVFFAGCLGIGFFSQVVNFKTEPFLSNDRKDRDKKANQESYFKNIDYFYHSKAEPSLKLKALDLSIIGGSENIFFIEPVGSAYQNDGTQVDYKAERGKLDKKKKLLELVQSVELTTGEDFYSSDQLSYDLVKDSLKGRGSVKTKNISPTGDETIEVESDIFFGKPKSKRFTYRGKVSGKVKRKRVYEQGLSFKADDVKVELPDQLIQLTGNVTLKKQQLTANSLRGDIFLDNYNKKLKYFVLYDDVKVTEKVTLEGPSGSQSFIRKAFSEQLEGVMSERLVILTGYPRVYQRDDVIKGNKIILRESVEIVEVDDAKSNILLKKGR